MLSEDDDDEHENNMEEKPAKNRYSNFFIKIFVLVSAKYNYFIRFPFCLTNASQAFSFLSVVPTPIIAS